VKVHHDVKYVPGQAQVGENELSDPRPGRDEKKIKKTEAANGESVKSNPKARPWWFVIASWPFYDPGPVLPMMITLCPE
jgi:hypothetical protein